MKIVNGVATYLVDGKEILIISDDYKGNPIIAHKPYMILIGSITFEKYKSDILFRDQIQIIITWTNRVCEDGL